MRVFWAAKSLFKGWEHRACVKGLCIQSSTAITILWLLALERACRAP